ncbi:hypothetical protein KP79_PYT00229 [Mizuhopecten yessoensis]|uniref:Uncharacterized protein n=1 Tax=Mizuhopecten yessoensis TaxID=6573 RepID=A0A210R3R4_MIZYE|nr:hypothetical protein KP79_PYT00229 [Mizuhopecten yessoensis]
MWRKRVGVSDSLPPWNKEHTSLQALVANFCYPRNWPSTAERESIRKDQKIYLTFGIHPRLVGLESEMTQQRWLRDLHSMCKAKNVVTVGECGFDTTDHPPAKILDFQQQMNR